MYIDVHTQCLSPASSLSLPPHRPGKEKGQAKAGLTPPHSAPPHPPASRPPGRDPGRWAESRSWVCLILLIGFNFSFASFSSGPCWSLGTGGEDRFMQLFSYIPYSEWGGGSSPLPLAPLSSHSSWVSVSACFHCCGGRLFELPPPPWSPGVWNGGGICLKRHFIIIKSIFTKPMLGSTWDEGLLRGGPWWTLDFTLESKS